MYVYVYVCIYTYIYIYIYNINIYIVYFIHASPTGLAVFVRSLYSRQRAIDSPCECEHNNPDSLDARLFFTVVLAVAPAVTMDEASSLSWTLPQEASPRQCSTLQLTPQGWGNYQELSCSLSRVNSLSIYQSI